MAKIMLTRRRVPIRSRPPTNPMPGSITQDAFDWACSMCTQATYLSAHVRECVEKKAFRLAYVGIRPAMESALKSLWVMGRVKEKAIPDNLQTLVKKVEDSLPKLHRMFSIQMVRKDGFGNDGYRKVNGWAHSDPEMWVVYKQGQEIEYVLVPLGNMVAYAQAELLLYDPLLVSQNRYWMPKD
jgi:hypothetical protein